MPDNPAPALVPSTLPGFQTAMVLPRAGVNLNKSLTDLTPDELSRLSNWVHAEGALTVRPGLTQHLAGLAGSVTAIRRLTDPSNALTRLFWGAGTSWLRGVDGGASEILETGFSGDPLTLVPIRKPQASGSWMLVADRTKMRKAGLAATGSLPIGLPAPSTAVASSVAPTYTKAIASFSASDSTGPDVWTPFAGLDDTGLTSGSAPSVGTVPGPSGDAVAFTLNPGSATTGFRSLAVAPKSLDLSTFTAGPAITDDDLFHLQLRLSDPSNIREVRLYLVCSPLSLTNQIPGTALDANTAAYMHAFQPSDYEAFIGAVQSLPDAAATAAGSTLIGNIPIGAGRIRPPGTPATGTAVPRAGQPSTQGGAGGANTWIEFSQIGLPLRRGDFLAIGTAGKPGTDWSTITGLYILIWTRVNRSLVVSFDDCYLTGGSGPDSTEPGAQKYDYRYTNYDTRTGARGNGSPIQSESFWLDAKRQGITLDPAAYGDPLVRQEFYRRGGSLTDNWRYVGVNTSDGGVFIDLLTDLATASADTLPVDHFQPVATLNSSGVTVLNQPVPILFGPLGDGIYCALGDPYRPGHLYACLAGEFDSWPSSGAYVLELCAPSEELMNGCVHGGGGFVLSRERGYSVNANPTGAGIFATPTECTPGLAARWGFCSGPGGIYYVARDGVRVTGGQDSQLLSNQIRPLFNGETVNGRAPINFAQPLEIRLALHNADLWLAYLDTSGNRQHAVYSLLYRYWRFVDFANGAGVTPATYSDETANAQSATGAERLLLGSSSGAILRHDGFSDLGIAIPASLRTGSWTFGQDRQDKLLGDVVVDIDPAGALGLLGTALNADTTINAPLVLPVVAAGRSLQQLQPFGSEPQRARSVSLDLNLLASASARPALYGLGIGVVLEPDTTLKRVTTWEPLPGGEGYLQGIRLDCDTFEQPKTVLVEVDLHGVTTTVATLTVQTAKFSGPSSRHTLWFSWFPVHGSLVRLRPTDLNPWTLWRADWLSTPSPPWISKWTSDWESPGGDRYYTGLDLEIDTNGVSKTLSISVDQVVIATRSVSALGRRYVHITLPTGRGHLFRFDATDENPGLLYRWEWLTTEEPREQSNWNAGYTTWSSLSDKYLKGLIIEADTFAQEKSVTIEADGVVMQTIAVNHTGRQVKNYTFPEFLGRVFRVIPVDGFASRPYTILPLFDEEPYALARWETQLLDFDLPGSGWGSVLHADVTYRSVTPATLTIQCYFTTGVLAATLTAELPDTGGTKRKVFVPFDANKGALFKLVFQTGDLTPGLTLYQEESRLAVQPWSGGGLLLKPFGNDATDPTRNMTNSVIAAGKSGGGS